MTFDYKNASDTELEKEFKRLGREMKDDRFFTKKEYLHLPEILTDDEEVLGFISGFMESNTWMIALTGRRIIFLDKGMIYGLKQQIINLDKINAVSCNTGIVFGSIIITDGAKDREVKMILKTAVRPFTNKIQEAIDHHKTLHQTAKAPSPDTHPSRYAELERLHDLKEKNVITEEEFLAEKLKILGKG